MLNRAWKIVSDTVSGVFGGAEGDAEKAPDSIAASSPSHQFSSEAQGFSSPDGILFTGMRSDRKQIEKTREEAGQRAREVQQRVEQEVRLKRTKEESEKRERERIRWVEEQRQEHDRMQQQQKREREQELLEQQKKEENRLRLQQKREREKQEREKKLLEQQKKEENRLRLQQKREREKEEREKKLLEEQRREQETADAAFARKLQSDMDKSKPKPFSGRPPPSRGKAASKKKKRPIVAEGDESEEWLPSEEERGSAKFQVKKKKAPLPRSKTKEARANTNIDPFGEERWGKLLEKDDAFERELIEQAEKAEAKRAKEALAQAKKEAKRQKQEEAKDKKRKEAELQKRKQLAEKNDKPLKNEPKSASRQKREGVPKRFELTDQEIGQMAREKVEAWKKDVFANNSYLFVIPNDRVMRQFNFFKEQIEANQKSYAMAAAVKRK
jgi:hypothetical protein